MKYDAKYKVLLYLSPHCLLSAKIQWNGKQDKNTTLTRGLQFLPPCITLMEIFLNYRTKPSLCSLFER